AFIVNPTLSRDELLEAILEEFGLTCSSPSKHKRLLALQEMLIAKQRAGGTAVLIIDEAHLLSRELFEEVRLLGNADTYKEKPLQIILSGQPELMPILGKRELPALRQRVASMAQLRPLSSAEARAYIAERLHAAGFRGNSMFQPAALNEIHVLSDGVPRVINLLCDSCLQAG